MILLKVVLYKLRTEGCIHSTQARLKIMVWTPAWYGYTNTTTQKIVENILFSKNNRAIEIFIFFNNCLKF